MEDGKNLQAQGRQRPQEMAEGAPAQGNSAGAIEGAAAPAGAGAVPAGDAGKLPEISRVGKDNFAAVYVATLKDQPHNGLIKFTDQEVAVLKSFLRTHNYQVTADELKLKKDSVQRILRRPNLKAYLHEIISKVAISEGTDIKWLMKELRLTWEGKIKPDESQRWAAGTLQKLLTPKGPGIGLNVNIQQNSYYGGLGEDAIDAEWADAKATSA